MTQLIGPDEIRRQIEVLDSRTPALGARIVARAWVDPAFCPAVGQRRAACEEEFGITLYDDASLIVLENTDKVHNLLVCTPCSCHPRPATGLPPDWYKSRPHRSRAVVEPRALLASHQPRCHRHRRLLGRRMLSWLAYHARNERAARSG